MKNRNYTEPKIFKSEDLKKSWYIYFYYNKKQFRFKYGINFIKDYKKRLAEAELVRQAINSKLRDGWNPTLPDIIVATSDLNIVEALDFALKKKKPNISTKTFLGYSSTLGFIKNSIKKLQIEHLPIIDTKRVHIKTILEHLKNERKASNKSYNKYLDHFRAILSELIQWDILEFNPANNIKNMQVAESIANKPATPEQQLVIKNHLTEYHKEFYNFIVTIFHTGIRPEEILKIKLSMVDMQLCQIILPAEITKTNIARIVPINKHLFEIYKSMRFDHLPKDYYLFGSFREAGKGNIGNHLDFIPGSTKLKRDTATKRWERIVKRGLGISVNMYSNKHAGANAKILAGMDLDALRELYGHTSKLMTTKYATVVKEVYRKQIMENSPDF